MFRLRLPRLVFNSSSALCLRSFSTSLPSPAVLYRELGYRPYTNNEAMNLLSFLDRFQHADNIDHVLSRLGLEQVNSIFRDSGRANLMGASPLVTVKLLTYLDFTKTKLCQTPEDLIFIYKKMGMAVFDKVPPSSILFSQIIDNKNALTKVVTALDYSHKKKFLDKLGMQRVKEILLRDKSSKNDLTPVLDWLAKHVYDQSVYKCGAVDRFITKHVFGLLCPIYLSTLEPIIESFYNVVQVFGYFDDKLRMLNMYGQLAKSYMNTIFDFNTFAELFKKEDDIQSLYETFEQKDIEVLLKKTIKNHPDVTYFQYESWLTADVTMRYPELAKIEFFEKLKSEALLEQASRYTKK